VYGKRTEVEVTPKCLASEICHLPTVQFEAFYLRLLELGADKLIVVRIKY
jgi:hypothetical protein